MRRHVTIRMVKRGHVICHMTCLRASEDYISQRNLESSEIQHMILKTFRDKKWIATKSTITERFFQEEAARILGSDNNLYCTNRTSLKTHSMLRSTVYIHGSTEATRRWEKPIEGNRSKEKVIEPYGSLWKTRDSSIGKLGKQSESGPVSSVK